MGFFYAGIELYNPAARRAAPSGICGRTALATRAGVCPASQVCKRPHTIWHLSQLYLSCKRTYIKAHRRGTESQHRREKKTITSTSSWIFFTTIFNPGCRIQLSVHNTHWTVSYGSCLHIYIYSYHARTPMSVRRWTTSHWSSHRPTCPMHLVTVK
jgi:hypothetical protein